MEEELFKTKQLAYFKENRDLLFEKIIPKDIRQDERSISIFMAGGPGAGKTEVATAFSSAYSGDVLIISPDDYRELFPDYEGENAHLYQYSSTFMAEKVHDYVLNKNINFIFDSMFANDFGKCCKNIDRSISRGRSVLILYIFQKPEIAWKFTKEREIVDKRKITRETFIRGFLSSRKNVNEIKKTYGNKIRIDIIIKDYKNDIEDIRFNVDSVDPYVKFDYTEEMLDDKIK